MDDDRDDRSAWHGVWADDGLGALADGGRDQRVLRPATGGVMASLGQDN